MNEMKEKFGPREHTLISDKGIADSAEALIGLVLTRCVTYVFCIINCKIFMMVIKLKQKWSPGSPRVHALVRN
jgi:hypothetical protein